MGSFEEGPSEVRSRPASWIGRKDTLFLANLFHSTTKIQAMARVECLGFGSARIAPLRSPDKLNEDIDYYFTNQVERGNVPSTDMLITDCRSHCSFLAPKNSNNFLHNKKSIAWLCANSSSNRESCN